MTDDATFERDLRAMLAARDPGPAPAALSAGVRARLADSGPRRLAAMGRWAGTAAALGAVAAVLILAVVVARPISIGPGSTPQPTPSDPYAIRPGDGVIAGEYYPAAQVVAGLVGLAGLAWLYASTTDRRRRVAAALGIVVIGYVAVTIGSSNAVGFATGVSGIEHGVNLSDSELFVDAEGDQPFTLYLTVTNTSRLPLEIEGMADESAKDHVLPRLMGLGVLSDASIELSTAPRLPFRPITLAPGDSIDLAVLGMAGSCAIHPTAGAGHPFVGIDSVGIVYEQLTIRHWASVMLPDMIHVAWPDTACR